MLSQTHAAIDADLAAARRERDEIRRQRARQHEELQRLATSGRTSADVAARIAHAHEQLSSADKRLPAIESRVAGLEAQTVTQAEARAVFADFDRLWKNSTPREQARLLNLLISTVEYDGKAGTVSVTLRPTSIRSLINRKLEDAA